MEPGRRATEPSAALLRRLFPTGDEAIRRYVDMLSTTAVERGLIGPREADRLWERHILNCVVVAECLPTGSHVVDLGSGAGLPGLVLALARPDLSMTLLEPMLRRASFLQEAVSALDVPNAVVCRARAEQVGSRPTTRGPAGRDGPAIALPVDAVVARAVAPLGRLAGWALPLIRPRGELVAMKGESAEAELTDARADLARLGAGRIRIDTVGEGVVSPPTTVVRIESTGRSAA